MMKMVKKVSLEFKMSISFKSNYLSFNAFWERHMPKNCYLQNKFQTGRDKKKIAYFFLVID